MGVRANFGSLLGLISKFHDQVYSISTFKILKFSSICSWIYSKVLILYIHKTSKNAYQRLYLSSRFFQKFPSNFVYNFGNDKYFPKILAVIRPKKNRIHYKFPL